MGNQESSTATGSSNMATQKRSVPTSASDDASPAPSSASHVGSSTLNTFQKRLLRQTWSHVANSGAAGGIGRVIFRNFLSKKPELRIAFQKTAALDVFAKEGAGHTLGAHEKLIADLLEETINSLDDLDVVGAKCVEFGAAHASLHGRGFDKNTWDVFGQTLLESITSLDIVRKHRELVRAWQVLDSFIVDKLRQGYGSAIRRGGSASRTRSLNVTSPEENGPGNREQGESEAAEAEQR